MKEPPCKDCIVLPCCKSRFGKDKSESVISFAYKTKCTIATIFFNNATQEEINIVRKIFGLTPY
jgi:hypothetical protein